MPNELLVINSSAGRILVAIGFFVFVGVGYVAIVLLHSASTQHKRGLSDLNPCGCLVTAFVTLILAAWARNCELR